MSEKDYVKYQLRNIPIKLLVSVVFSWFAFSSSDGGANNLFGAIAVGVCLYGMMTCLSAFAKAASSWFFGLILFGVLAAILASNVLPSIVNVLVGIALLFGGVVRDIYRIVRLVKITIKEKQEGFMPNFDGSSLNLTSSDDLNRVIDNYNNILSVVQNNFNNLVIVLREKNVEPTRYQQLLSEYTVILNTSKEANTKIQTDSGLSPAEMGMLKSTIEKCQADMQTLYNKQLAYLEEVAKQNNNSTNNVSSIKSSTTEYFTGCDTRESLSKRYRDLCKVYHPDMGNGSSEIFNKIQDEYNALKKKYE